MEWAGDIGGQCIQYICIHKYDRTGTIVYQQQGCLIRSYYTPLSRQSDIRIYDDHDIVRTLRSTTGTMYDRYDMPKGG